MLSGQSAERVASVQASISKLKAEQAAAQEGKRQLQQSASAYTAQIQGLQAQLQAATPGLQQAGVRPCPPALPVSSCLIAAAAAAAVAATSLL